MKFVRQVNANQVVSIARTRYRAEFTLIISVFKLRLAFQAQTIFGRNEGYRFGLKSRRSHNASTISELPKSAKPTPPFFLPLPAEPPYSSYAPHYPRLLCPSYSRPR
jgi:hypothetical protein